ncbi:hypothetical protein RIF29_29771 [Crotalaria pallida]|uniref:Uncharacterized protein n=1 Tax=Crotalaria pallida TaxID=3830 RepID=A0AAN9HWI3_CROPI
MTILRFSFIRKTQEEQPYVNPNLDPVLLVPGIGGSMLNAVDDRNGTEERVWVRFLSAEYTLKTKLWSRYDPSTGKPSFFSLFVEIHPKGLRKARRVSPTKGCQ